MFAVGSDLKSGVDTAALNAVQADAPPSVLHVVNQDNLLVQLNMCMRLAAHYCITDTGFLFLSSSSSSCSNCFTGSQILTNMHTCTISRFHRPLWLTPL